MLDKVKKKALHQKVWTLLLTGPATLAPLGLGLVGLISSVGIESVPSMVGFAGVVLALGGITGAVMRFVAGPPEHLIAKAVDEIEDDIEKERKQHLYTLRQQLSEDGDYRTQDFFDELHRLVKEFEQSKEWADNTKSIDSIEIYSGVQNLFEEVMSSLERSLAMDRRSRTREALIAEIELSLNYLRDLLKRVDDLKVSEDSNHQSKLRAVIDDIDERMAFAAEVQQQREIIEKRLEPDFSRYTDTAKETE